MSIKITIPNSSSDVLTFGSGNTPTAAQIAGIDSGSSNGQLALYTTASGTSTERVRVDASGNVGIGTASPAYKLDVVVASNKRVVAFTPTSSSGISDFSNGGVGWNFTRPDDGAFRSSIFSYNTAADAKNNFAIQARADMVFATGGDFSTSTERMRIDNSGNLLVGDTAVVNNELLLTKKNSGAQSVQRIWNTATSGNNGFIVFVTEATNTERGGVTYNRAGGLVSFNTTSDYRAKTVKGNVENSLEKVALLKPCYGRMNDAEQDIDFFVAHELQEVVPSAVIGEKDSVNEDGSPKYQMVDKSALIPLLTAAIQEQQAIITSLTDRITALEGAK